MRKRGGRPSGSVRLGEGVTDSSDEDDEDEGPEPGMAARKTPKEPQLQEQKQETEKMARKKESRGGQGAGFLASPTLLLHFTIHSSLPRREKQILGRVVESFAFQATINMLIVINSIIFSFYDPLNPDSRRNQAIESSEWFFQAAFTLEAVLKLLHYGPKGYFCNDSWNVFDFSIVVGGWVAIAMSPESSTNFTGLRVIRILRTFRAMKSVPGMQTLLKVVRSSAAQLFTVFILGLFVFVSFGIIGVGLFATADPEGRPGPPGIVGFRNLGEALLTIFQVITLEGWADIMEWTVESFGPASRIYFVLLTLLGSFLLVNFIVAVLAVNHSLERASSASTKEKRLIEEIYAEARSRAKRQRHAPRDMLTKKLPRPKALLVRQLSRRLSMATSSGENGNGHEPQDSLTNLSKRLVKRYTSMAANESNSREEEMDRNATTRESAEMRLMFSYEVHQGHSDYITSDQYFEWREKYGERYIRWRTGCVGYSNVELLARNRHRAAQEAANKGNDLSLSYLRARRSSSLAMSYGSSRNMTDLPRSQNSSRQLSFVSRNRTEPGLQLDRVPCLSGCRRFCVERVGKCLFTGNEETGLDAVSAENGNCTPKQRMMYERVSLFVITVYTIILCSEHFLQPNWMFEFIRVSSMVFIVLSFVDIGLRFTVIEKRLLPVQAQKLLYFDALVVLVGTFVWVYENTGAVLCCRAIRLLQIHRTMSRPVTGLDSFLKTVAVALRKAVPFAMILAIFIQVFTVMGLHIFGGKFEVEGNADPRTNYDTYLWSFVTTFQVLTGEAWHEVMYLAVEGTGVYYSFIYFIVLVALGNFIILGLLLAIMIDTFLEAVATRQMERVRATSFNDEVQYHVLNAILKAREGDRASGSTRSLETLVRQRRRPSPPSPMSSFSSISSPALSDGPQPENENGINDTELALESNLESQNAPILPSDASEGNHVNSRVSAVFWGARRLVLRLLRNPFIDAICLACIILYCVDLVFIKSWIVQVVCSVVFIVEFLLRWIAFDFVSMDGFILDLVVVVVLSLSLGISTPETNALRALVALRFIHWSDGLQIMFLALKRAVRPCAIVASVCFVVFSLFSIMFQTILQGRFRTCIQTDLNGIKLAYTNRTCFPFPQPEYRALDGCTDPALQCIDDSLNLTWGNLEPFNFDGYFSSMLTLFEIATLENWMYPMYAATDVTHIGQTPVRGSHDLYSLLFVLFACLAHLLLLQFFIAVVVDAFMTTHGEVSGNVFLTPEQRRWVDMQSKCMFQRPRSKKEPRSWFRLKCFRIAESRRFEIFILVAILFDTFAMCLQRLDQPNWITVLNNVAQYLSGSIYIMEAMIKISAYGKAYFTSLRDLFDLLIVIVVIVGWFVEQVKVFSVLRVLRLANALPPLRSLLRALYIAGPSIANTLRIFVLVLFVYGAMGLYLFPDSPYFSSLNASLITLYRIATADEWNTIMHDLETVHHRTIVNAFCISYYFLSSIAVVNFFVAVLLSNFEQEFMQRSFDQQALSRFRMQWNKHWRATREMYLQRHESNHVSIRADGVEQRRNVPRFRFRHGYIPATEFPALLFRMRPPIGFDLNQGSFNGASLLRLINLAQIPITKDGFVNYNATLFAMIDLRHRIDSNFVAMPTPLQDVALQLNLSAKHRKKFVRMRAELNLAYHLAHHLGAVIIQIRFREFLNIKSLSRKEKLIQRALSAMSATTEESKLHRARSRSSSILSHLSDPDEIFHECDDFSQSKDHIEYYYDDDDDDDDEYYDGEPRTSTTTTRTDVHSTRTNSNPPHTPPSQNNLILV